MRKFSLPYFFWALVFIVFPLVLIFFFSFQTNPGLAAKNPSFTLENYRKFLTPLYLNVLYQSLKMALVSTILCLILGYPLAYFISQLKKDKRDFFLMLILIPMWMNFLLRTYAWITLLGKKGLINNVLGLLGLGPFSLMYNKGAILVGMVYNFLPFMVLPVYSVLIKIEEEYIEAAKDLGATSGQVFSRVILPLSLPGVLSGLGMVFIPAISTFVIPGFLGGNKYPFIGNFIEQQFRFTGNWPFGSALSVSLLVILLVFLLLGWALKRGQGRGKL